MVRCSWSAFVLLVSLFGFACGGDDSDGASFSTVDPGTEAWELVPSERVAEECGLDPELLRAADEMIGGAWAVVRYGKLCHEYYPSGGDDPVSLASTTKTLGAAVVGAVAYQTRGLRRSGRKTGPVSDADRVDHWLDEFSFNPDAQIGHVLGMVAFNEDLSLGSKDMIYDAAGTREINRLSDVLNTAIAQDVDRFGANLEEFTQRYLFEKLGMRNSTWSDGQADKIFGFSWVGTTRDMARLGLLLLNGGVWSGERLLEEEWVYKMTHPAFEDANTSYGYLTWLAASSNYNFGGIVGIDTFDGPLDPCSPSALNRTFPHGISEATDCNYAPPWDCSQDNDVGVWYAAGAGGSVVVGHPGLDMVLIGKRLGGLAFHATLWGPLRPALVSLDPLYQGDEEAFCADYGRGGYAPDWRLAGS